MTPFDSGGLYWNFINADPKLGNLEDKKKLFSQYNRSLHGWADAFRVYIAENYDTIPDYIQGSPPRIGSPPIVNAAPNSSPAWTYEARVSRRAFRPEQVQPVRLYWHLAQSDSFLFWVETESSYDDPVQEHLTAWVIDHQVLCPVSESPAVRAGIDLIEASKGFEVP